MIVYWILKMQLKMLEIVLNLLNQIPGIDSLNESLQPYITALTNLINSGATLIGYFLPIGLLKVLIPVVITIELLTEGFDVFQWIYNKIRGC